MSRSHSAPFVWTVADLPEGLPLPDTDIDLGDGCFAGYVLTDAVPLCVECRHALTSSEILPCNDYQGFHPTGRSYFEPSAAGASKRGSGCGPSPGCRWRGRRGVYRAPGRI
jgi:hypothetical protein